MAISIVRQSGKIQGTGNAPLGVNYSFSVLPAVGNTIIVTVFGWSNVNPGYSVSDNQGNTYTLNAFRNTGGFGSATVFSAPVNTSAGTFTVTVTNNGSGASTVNFNAQEVGVLSSTPFDKSSSTTGSSTTPSTGTTATTTVASEILVGCQKNDGNSGIWSANASGSTPSSGWILEINETDDGVFGAGATADIIVSATGAYVHVWSHTGGASPWGGCIATFAAPVASSGIPSLIVQPITPT